MSSKGAIQASGLAPEELHAGDTIEYYSMMYVCGDPRGRRETIVLTVRPVEEEEFPIRVDTSELLPLTMLIKRTFDRHGNAVVRGEGEAAWRKLRTFVLVRGAVSAPSRAQVLNANLRTIVDDVFQRRSARRAQQPVSASAGECDEATAALRREPDTSTEPGHLTRPSQVTTALPHSNRFQSVRNAQLSPTDAEITAADGAFTSVPTHAARAKIRHQRKQKPGCFYITRSRKRKNQKKRAPVRDSKNIYHARTEATMPVREFLLRPGVAARLAEIRKERAGRRAPLATDKVVDLTSDFEPSAPTPNQPEPRCIQPKDSPVEWSDDVVRIDEPLNPDAVAFRDTGRLGSCLCQSVGDCFRDSCHNAVMNIFCSKNNCAFGGRCGNSPTLKLFRGCVGIGVYTETALDVGDIVGEYCGVLSPYDGIHDATEDGTRLKQNSGYTLLLRTRSTKNKFVYIEPEKYGGITQFVNRSCTSNACFIELRNRQSVKIFVVVERTFLLAPR